MNNYITRRRWARLSAVLLALLGTAMTIGPTAGGHAGGAYWTRSQVEARIGNHAPRVRIEGRTYKVVTPYCKGEGRGVVRAGRRAWTHFGCTGVVVAGIEVRQAYFRAHVITASRFITTNGQFLQ